MEGSCPVARAIAAAPSPAYANRIVARVPGSPCPQRPISNLHRRPENLTASKETYRQRSGAADEEEAGRRDGGGERKLIGIFTERDAVFRVLAREP
jgi:hypothetical protein